MGNTNQQQTCAAFDSVSKSTSTLIFQQKQEQEPDIVKQYPDSIFNLFICNTYLIPSLGINVKNTIACREQSSRAEALGKLIMHHKPQIVCLQETWGAGLGPLEKELTNAPSDNQEQQQKYPYHYEIEECCKTYGGWTIADVVAQRMNKRGGLYVAHLKENDSKAPASIQKLPFDGSLESKWYTFENSLTKSKKGCVVTKYIKTNLPSLPLPPLPNGQQRKNLPPPTLYVFNTHLDPSNKDDVQIRQLQELSIFINQVLMSEASQTAKKNEELRKNNQPDLPLWNFGAIIVGDFNFGKSAPQFKKMFDVFEKVGGIELDEEFSNSLNHDVSTYDGSKNPYVYWGAGKKDLGRIDLIFGIKSVGAFPIRRVEIVQEQVLTDVYVSDHFPFEVQLRIV